MPTVNFLYDNPAFYDAMLGERHAEIIGIAERFRIAHFGERHPRLLDVGCGTGTYLPRMGRNFRSIVGIDCNAAMIAYGKSLFPAMDIRVADMRTMDLGERFDVLVSFGSVLTYAVTDSDFDDTLDAIRRHLTEEGKLLVSCWNASGFLGNDRLLRSSGEVVVGDSSAYFTAEFSFDRRAQRLIRRRKWTTPAGQTHDDYCEYRMLFPSDLTYRFRRAGLTVTGIFGDSNLSDAELHGIGMFITAEAGSK